ncbi:LPXTG cell wall anchor domain-containing protein [Streptomyces sp. NPDC059851]|uniref:LPXTG cell wall anchor domain-containing protein n=1 Tax=Streptomyces sp. NPDC059851 TaxID=3346971 RepID=UPI0036525D59
MPARTAARRRVRAAAATAVVAAVAGTALMPLSAYAATAEDNGALKITMSVPEVPSGPLKRGGATEAFELTVTNPSNEARAFHPWIDGLAAGPGLLQKSDVTFKIEPIDAPPTESSIGQQNGGWQATFYPADKSKDGFEVPAGRKLTWRVTVGLGASYPTNKGELTLDASSYKDEVPAAGKASRTFKTDTPAHVGKFTTAISGIGPCQGSTAPDCRELNVKYRVTGGGEFNTALATKLTLHTPDGATPDVQVRAAQAGTAWQDVKPGAGNNGFTLPEITKSFSAASGEHTTRLQIKLGPKAKLTKATQINAIAEVGFAQGNTWAFDRVDTKIELAPPTTTSPSPSPSGSASPSPSASTSPSPSASASTTAATTGTTTTTTTGSSGTLANTGASSNTGLYSALAAALVATGGAAVWLGARRRKAACRA